MSGPQTGWREPTIAEQEKPHTVRHRGAPAGSKRFGKAGYSYKKRVSCERSIQIMMQHRYRCLRLPERQLRLRMISLLQLSEGCVAFHGDLRTDFRNKQTLHRQLQRGQIRLGIPLCQ